MAEQTDITRAEECRRIIELYANPRDIKRDKLTERDLQESGRLRKEQKHGLGSTGQRKSCPVLSAYFRHFVVWVKPQKTTV